MSFHSATTCKAVILAAGKGMRLSSLTGEKPKCLVRVCGKPILQYQIEAFSNAGIEEIIFIVGYKAENVKKFLRRFNGPKIKIIENKDFAITNNMYSLWLAKEELFSQGGFVLCNGDVVFNGGMISRLISTSPDRIVCDRGKYNKESMKISISAEKFIDDISKSIPAKKAFGNSIDVYYFSEDSCKVLFSELAEIIEKEKKTNEWTEVALQRILKRKKIRMTSFVLQQKEKWVEIDNMEDLLLADRLFSKLSYSDKHKKLFFIDLDGTVYLGDRMIQGADEFISKLKSAGKKYFFISNNSSKAKKDYVEKLERMNIKADEGDIVLSSDGVKAFLKKKEVTDIFLVSSNSMRQNFLDAGFRVVSHVPEFVVLGYDTEINYQKICRAAIHLNRGVPFIATHADVVCPSEEGPIPDIGSMIAMFKKATGVEPMIFGKPRKEMIEHLIESSGLDRSEIVIIGDRLYTDMKLASHCGVDFICVLSGETTRDNVEKSEVFPNLIVSNLSDLVHLLN